MCRLYGQISAQPAPARDFLLDGERSLLAQSDNPRRPQKDGWGVAWFDASGRPRIDRSPKPAYRDRERYSARAAAARSRVVIGHLRAATNPLGLARKRLIREANTQPFTDGRFVFAHNGGLAVPREIASLLGPWRDKLTGENDSEVYFYLFRKHLDAAGGDMARALEESVRELWTVWRWARAAHPKNRFPYHSLNVLVSDGRSLHAFCHAPRPAGFASFFEPSQDWTVMARAERGGRVILASESLDGGRWTRLRDGELVSVSSGGGRLKTSVRRLDVRSLMAPVSWP